MLERAPWLLDTPTDASPLTFTSEVTGEVRRPGRSRRVPTPAEDIFVACRRWREDRVWRDVSAGIVSCGNDVVEGKPRVRRDGLPPSPVRSADCVRPLDAPSSSQGVCATWKWACSRRCGGRVRVFLEQEPTRKSVSLLYSLLWVSTTFNSFSSIVAAIASAGRRRLVEVLFGWPPVPAICLSPRSLGCLRPQSL